MAPTPKRGVPPGLKNLYLTYSNTLGRGAGSVWDCMHSFAGQNPQACARLDQIRRAIGHSRAPATNKAYAASYKKFKRFCKAEGLALDRVTEAEFAFYLQGIADEGGSVVHVAHTVAAVSWFSQMAEMPDPTKHQLISAIVSAAQRDAPPTKHKEPITIAHLKAIRDFAKAKNTYSSACTYAIAIALYASCSRLDETVNLRIQHIKIHHNYVRLFIPPSKTDQYKGGVTKCM